MTEPNGPAQPGPDPSQPAVPRPPAKAAKKVPAKRAPAKGAGKKAAAKGAAKKAPAKKTSAPKTPTPPPALEARPPAPAIEPPPAHAALTGGSSSVPVSRPSPPPVPRSDAQRSDNSSRVRLMIGLAAVLAVVLIRRLRRRGEDSDEG